MKVGDPVLFVPDCWVHGQGSESMLAHTGAVRGKVVYIDPKGYYYVAEGQVRGRTIREAFSIIPKNGKESLP